MNYEAPGLPTNLARLYICQFCLIEMFGLVAAMPLAEYTRIVADFNAQAAERQAQIAELRGFQVDRACELGVR